MRYVSIAALVGLAACASVAPPVEPLPLARAQIDADAAANVAGEARFPVRAVSAAGDAVTADCTAEGSGFSAAFVAPAEVAVPSFGPASGPVTVRCTAGGLSGARVAQSSARRANGLAGWPAVGVGVSSGGGSYVSVGGFWGGGWGTGPETYAVSYPPVVVILE